MGWLRRLCLVRIGKIKLPFTMRGLCADANNSQVSPRLKNGEMTGFHTYCGIFRTKPVYCTDNSYCNHWHVLGWQRRKMGLGLEQRSRYQEDKKQTTPLPENKYKEYHCKEALIRTVAVVSRGVGRVSNRQNERADTVEKSAAKRTERAFSTSSEASSSLQSSLLWAALRHVQRTIYLM